MSQSNPPAGEKQHHKPPPPRRKAPTSLKEHEATSTLIVAPQSVDSCYMDEAFWKEIKDISHCIQHILPNPTNITGGFADVYLGTHAHYGKVAMKRPKMSSEKETSDVYKRLRDEVNQWRKLEHDYVLEFMGICRKDGHIYVVSPWMDNGTILQYTSRSEVDRIELLYEAALAVAFLHAQNVIHGDIKSANFLVSNHGTTLICDFGLAKLENSQTFVGYKGAGSLRWRSPALMEGGSKDAKSDTWAFGMTICEVLTGGLPYAQYQYNHQVHAAILRGEVPDALPMFTRNTTNYPAWRAALHCWVKRERRLPMADIASMLKIAAKPTSPPEETAQDPIPRSDSPGPADPAVEVEESIAEGAVPESCGEAEREEPQGEDVTLCVCDWDEVKPAIECTGAHSGEAWYHLDCIGLDKKPENWLCIKCETSSNADERQPSHDNIPSA